MSQLPTKMKGVQLIGHGGFDKLKYNEAIPVPTPGDNDVLIKVLAAGVNNTDLNTRIGWYSKSNNDSSDAGWSGNALQFPLIQGADVCGIVVAVGKNVDTNRIGERVLIEPCLTEVGGKILDQPWYFGSECNGGFAEYTVVAAKHSFKINSTLSDIELASFPCSYSTAENLLTRSNVSANDTLLITGASGGVGSAAIQLAKARGARVIAITSPEKSEKLMQLGTDKILTRKDDIIKALGKNTIDVVIDLVAGKDWPKLLEVLKPFGRYATSGAIAGPIVELDVRTLYLKDLTLLGCTILEPQVFPNLIKRIESDDIAPLVAQTFDLKDIEQAQTLFEKKQHIGKLVLKVSN